MTIWAQFEWQNAAGEHFTDPERVPYDATGIAVGGTLDVAPLVQHSFQESLKRSWGSNRWISMWTLPVGGEMLFMMPWTDTLDPVPASIKLTEDV